jgi:soluble lytic murein transglycosylase
MLKSCTLVISLLLLISFLQTATANELVTIKKNYTVAQKKFDSEQNKLNSSSRKLFKKALVDLKKNNKKFKKDIKQLGDYSLVVYLHYKKLLTRLSHAKNKEIKNFIENYKETPYAERIQKKWLDKLAKKKDWKTYLDFYTTQKSTRRQCDYLNALIHTSNKKQAFELVEPLWLSNKSQPKSCDPVFKAWDKAGLVSTDLRWQRIALVMTKSRLSLAKYIARPMSKKDKKILNEWIFLHRKPEKLLKSTILTTPHKMQQAIILHSIKRRARRKPKQAGILLTKIKTMGLLDQNHLNLAYRSIGLSFARKHKLGGWYWLDKITDDYTDVYTLEWRARAAVREQNNKAILSSINRLPIEKQKSQRWQFWLAKTTEAMGNKKLATQTYQELAKKRGYYAFLAADQTNSSYQLNDKPLVFDQQSYTNIRNNPGIKRAYEFLMLGMKLEAKREWYFITRIVFDKPQRAIAAKIAQNWNWHDRAILTIAYTDERDDINLRFPLILESKVEKYSTKNKIEAAYTYAVIRRESAFALDARSPVGAIGLMQLMPATGKEVAKKLKLPYKNKKQLYATDFNLQLGTDYLHDMLKKFDQQPALASAAYNAGGHRVKAWLPKGKKLSAINWVESIPFTETREYVSAILAYTAIYQHRLGKPMVRLEDRMPDVPFK